MAATQTDGEGPLRILIAGAGIGGLTAAISLRQQGHHVEVFEQSKLAQEIGAAVHLGPNCNGLLRRIGLNPDDIGAVTFNGITTFDAKGKQLSTRADRKKWRYPYQMVHRAHLHTALKEIAVAETGPGTPVVLRLSSRVQSADAENARLVFESGEVVQGDLVLGADGVRSQTRKAIPGGDLPVFPTHERFFRFTVPTAPFANEPDTFPWVRQPGYMFLWNGPDRRVIMYPCSNNTAINVGAFFPRECHEPDAASEPKSSSTSPPSHNPYTTGYQVSTKAKLLELFDGFAPAVLRVAAEADEKDCKVWPLLDMNTIPSFVHERFALLGDAAHPFLPFQGQGAAQAIEDGVSLGAVLPLGTPKSAIPERLRLYNSRRYERAHLIQERTRMVGNQYKPNGDVDLPSNLMRDFQRYNFNHDEFEASTEALHKFLASSSSKDKLNTAPTSNELHTQNGLPGDVSSAQNVRAAA